VSNWCVELIIFMNWYKAYSVVWQVMNSVLSFFGQATFVDAPLEVFRSPSVLPDDPVLRKQRLEDLMMKIHQTESFSFMQV